MSHIIGFPYQKCFDNDDSHENRAELPGEVFDAGEGDDSGAVAEEVWHQWQVKGGI